MPYFTGFLQENFTSHTTDIGIGHRTCFSLFNTRGFPGGAGGKETACQCCCCCWVASVGSDSVRPHRRQPTRLPRPWDSPGKNTGVGCHFLLQCTKVKSQSEVTQSCPTLTDPMDCSLPGFSIHGILQARVLEWGSIAQETQKTRVQSLGWENLPEEGMVIHSSIFA